MKKTKNLFFLLLFSFFLMSLSSCSILKEDCDCPSFSKANEPTEKHI